MKHNFSVVKIHVVGDQGFLLSGYKNEVSTNYKKFSSVVRRFGLDLQFPQHNLLQAVGTDLSILSEVVCMLESFNSRVIVD